MIKNFLVKQSDAGILILRLVIGLAFIFVHGWGKFFGGPEFWSKLGGAMSNFGITFAPVFWGFMAAFTEFAGAILISLGLFTRTASLFLAFTMFVAFIMHTSKHDPWMFSIYPLEMLSVFTALSFIGAGKYSLDYLLFSKKSH